MAKIGEIELNRIYCMDCQEGLKKIPDGSVDLIATDPPYEVDYGKKSKILSENEGGGREKQIERDKNITEWECDYDEMSREFYRVLKDNTHCYVFCTSKQFVKWYIALQKAGFKFRNHLVWIKNRPTFTINSYSYNYKTESCIFVGKGSKKLNRPKGDNVLNYKCVSCKNHPTTKPQSMWMRLIKASSKEGDLILDPFMGAGGVAQACKSLKRDYIGFEISPVFVEKANQELKQKTLW